MIKIRGGYSEEAKIISFSVDMQIDDFDERARIVLNNYLYEALKKIFKEGVYRYGNGIGNYHKAVDVFCKEILSDVFLQSIILKDGYGYDWIKVYNETIYKVIMCAPYNEVLDLLWYITNWVNKNMRCNRDLYKLFNDLFEREFVGYRFINGRIVAITDQIEINSIESVCNNSQYSGCRTHMQKAVGFLADRQKKDYKNSIKESISVVESICQVIAGDEKATLGQALNKIEHKGIDLHPALKRGFASLYGYTSDQGGIRHCEGIFESDVSFEEAKYMLVSCSAFINYLIAENEKFGK